MTKQETFDKVVRAVIAQGRPSVEMGTCRYRMKDGRRCAAGHLLPDEVFAHPAFVDGRTIMSNGVVANAIRDAGHDFDLVCQLQSAHDGSTSNFGNDQFLMLFRLNARRVAERHELSAAALDEGVAP